MQQTAASSGQTLRQLASPGAAAAAAEVPADARQAAAAAALRRSGAAPPAAGAGPGSTQQQQQQFSKGQAVLYRTREGDWQEAKVSPACGAPGSGGQRSACRPCTSAPQLLLAAAHPLPPGQVVAVDQSLQPPSYTIELGGNHRETEGSRLLPLPPQPEAVQGLGHRDEATEEKEAAVRRLEE